MVRQRITPQREAAMVQWRLLVMAVSRLGSSEGPSGDSPELSERSGVGVGRDSWTSPRVWIMKTRKLATRRRRQA